MRLAPYYACNLLVAGTLFCLYKSWCYVQRTYQSMICSRMVRISATAVICSAMISCASSEHDRYLNSLKLEPERLEVIDSVNIDQFDMFQARAAVDADNGWLLVSAVDGEYKLLFLNPKTSEHFFAIRKGRGPGEMVDGSNLHKNGIDAIFYDYNSAVCVKINLKESIKRREIVMDTVGRFTYAASRPVYMTSCGDSGFISGNLTTPDVWYSYYDRDGVILSEVPSLNFKEHSDGGDYQISMMLSSVYTSDPDGSKVCVANVVCPSLSFSVVESVTEYKRYENPPIGMKSGRVTEDFKGAFNGICADAKYVYLLYSGHRWKGDRLPVNECIHVIVYDWDGNPRRHYVLDRNISSVYVDGNILIGATSYPESKVYKFIM